MGPIVIVGGGLAGLTLGILLRRSGAAVDLWEAAPYPRHRVCGEFISGRGAYLLLELLPPLAGQVCQVETVRFFNSGESTPPLRLPVSGLSISRWNLDAALAAEFQAAGGRLIRERWPGRFDAAGIVRATGRRRIAEDRGWSGLKIHARGLELKAGLEMHFSPFGYLGISRLPQGTNLCALANSSANIANFRRNPLEVFEQFVSCREDVQRLRAAQADPASLTAVSGISFRDAPVSGECCVGDAIRMIAPFTGNGMSLAIESAFAAAPALIEYTIGAKEWPAVVRDVRAVQRKRFQYRFASAQGLRCLADRSWTRRLMLSTLRTVPGMLSICFGITRS